MHTIDLSNIEDYSIVTDSAGKEIEIGSVLSRIDFDGKVGVVHAQCDEGDGNAFLVKNGNLAYWYIGADQAVEAMNRMLVDVQFDLDEDEFTELAEFIAEYEELLV